jgi:hypothetical protein
MCQAVQFFREVPQAVGATGHKHQSVTAAGEFAGNLLADARRRTGDDDGAVVACRRKHGTQTIA